MKYTIYEFTVLPYDKAVTEDDFIDNKIYTGLVAVDTLGGQLRFDTAEEAMSHILDNREEFANKSVTILPVIDIDYRGEII